MEVHYALMTYGILIHSLPIDTSGTLDLSYVKREVEKYYNNGKNGSASSKRDKNESNIIIDIPASNDVVLGRGYPYQQFPGNLRLAILIDSYREMYSKSNRTNKTKISNMIVQMVKNQQNGRFITKQRSNADNRDSGDDDTVSSNNNEGYGGWVIVSDEVAREKVSHGFRTKTKKSATLMLKEAMGGEGALLTYGGKRSIESKSSTTDGNDNSSGQPQQPQQQQQLIDIDDIAMDPAL